MNEDNWNVVEPDRVFQRQTVFANCVKMNVHSCIIIISILFIEDMEKSTFYVNSQNSTQRPKAWYLSDLRHTLTDSLTNYLHNKISANCKWPLILELFSIQQTNLNFPQIVLVSYRNMYMLDNVVERALIYEAWAVWFFLSIDRPLFRHAITDSEEFKHHCA